MQPPEIPIILKAMDHEAYKADSIDFARSSFAEVRRAAASLQLEIDKMEFVVEDLNKAFGSSPVNLSWKTKLITKKLYVGRLVKQLRTASKALMEVDET